MRATSREADALPPSTFSTSAHGPRNDSRSSRTSRERLAHACRRRLALEELGKRATAEQDVRERDVGRRHEHARPELGRPADAVADDGNGPRERALERSGARRAQRGVEGGERGAHAGTCLDRRRCRRARRPRSPGPTHAWSRRGSVRGAHARRRSRGRGGPARSPRASGSSRRLTSCGRLPGRMATPHARGVMPSASRAATRSPRISSSAGCPT